MLAEFTAITRNVKQELPPRYYTKRRVRFIVIPSPSGAWSLTPAGDGDGFFLAVPTVYRAGIKPSPMLIADTALYVLGVPKDDTAEARRAAAARHADYTALIDSFAAANPEDPVASQLAAFAHGPFPTALARRLADLGGTSSDLVTFAINGGYAHETPQAQSFWTAEVARRKGTGVQAVCCVCGGTAPALASLPESIPGHAIPVVDNAGRAARGQPTQLVSINNAAQGRSGIIQLANTPICPDCGSDAVAGLLFLLDNKDSHRRNRDSVLAWWSTGAALNDLDLLGAMDKANPEVVSQLLDKLNNSGTDTPWVSSRARRFRAVTLAANKSRVVIRGQIDISLQELGSNLTAWFEDHRIDTGKDSDGTRLGLWQMAAATGRPAGGGDGYLPDSRLRGIEDALLACALGHAALPIRLLPHLLHRITHDGVIDAPRAALLRLCLRRPPRPSAKEATMIGLNQDATETAYQCGRLFRVLEDIQQTAIPEISATLVDRHRAISRNPAVLRTLVENSRPHLKRMRRSQKTTAAAAALEVRLEEVLERINPFPAHFTVNDQGLFVLGYYHQRAWDRRQREAGAAAKRAREAGGPGSSADARDPDPGDPTPGH